MTTLKNTRSLIKGEISMDEIHKTLSASELKENFMEWHLNYAESNDMECDTVVCIGDLVIDGNLELGDEICNLIVTGSLTVNGLLEHYDDEPATHIYVGGNLKAKNLITGGTLEVKGNVDVEGAIIGHYNDCFAIIKGNATAGFFYPEEHFFKIEGTISFKLAYGNEYRVDNGKSNKVKNDIEFMSDRAFYHLINHDILVDPVSEEEAEELDEMDDYCDYVDSKAMYEPLREGKSIFRS